MGPGFPHGSSPWAEGPRDSVRGTCQFSRRGLNTCPTSPQHPEVAWQDMRDMRNIIIHAYFNVDLTIVWRTVQEDLPPLKQQINQLLGNLRSTINPDARSR